MNTDWYWAPAKRSTCFGNTICPFKWIYDDTIVDYSPGFMDHTVEVHQMVNGINYNNKGSDCLSFIPMDEIYNMEMWSMAKRCFLHHKAICEISIKKN